MLEGVATQTGCRPSRGDNETTLTMIFSETSSDYIRQPTLKYSLSHDFFVFIRLIKVYSSVCIAAARINGIVTFAVGSAVESLYLFHAPEDMKELVDAFRPVFSFLCAELCKRRSDKS